MLIWAKGFTCFLRQLVPYQRDRKLGPDDWPLCHPLGLRARKDSSNDRLHGSLCVAFAFHQGLTITQLKDDPMNTGTVKWFNEQKGYGFVQPDNGSKDVFVHISAVERAGLRTLKEGQKVSFEIVTDKRTGKSSAGNLTAA
jgi:cold shock protein